MAKVLKSKNRAQSFLLLCSRPLNSADKSDSIAARAVHLGIGGWFGAEDFLTNLGVVERGNVGINEVYLRSCRISLSEEVPLANEIRLDILMRALLGALKAGPGKLTV